MSDDITKCWLRQCVHYIGTNEDGLCVCRAFPCGIPYDIAFGDNSHNEPYPEDNGIRFEKDMSYE